MDDFELERDLEDAGIDAFDFSLMDEDERREALEDAFLDPDMYMYADLSSSFHAWEQLQSAGLNLSDLDFLDEDERREKLESAGLDPDDYEDGSSYFFHSAPVSSPPVQHSPAPHTAPVKTEDAPVPPEPREVFRYLLVRFSASGKSYAYRTDDRTISAGAQVMVPVGDDNAPVLALVISAGDYAAEVAPYPPEKTKTILRRATAEDLSAHKQPKPAETPAAPSVSRSTQAPASSPEEAHFKEEPLREAQLDGNNARKRKALIAVIAVLSGIVVILLGIVMSNLSVIREDFELWQEKIVLEQMEQNRQYFLSVAEKYEADVVEDVYEELNSKYRHKSLWEFTEDYTIHIESEVVESTWKETVYVDVTAEESFDDYSDASKVASLYDYSVDPLNELHSDNEFFLPSQLRTLVRNNGYERSVLCHVTITTAENTYEYERGDGVKSGFDYFYLNGERHDVVLEPRSTPVVTPRPSTSSRTSSSAPYVGQYVTEATTSKWEWMGEWYNYNGTGMKVVGYYYRTTEHAYSIKVDPQTNCIVEVSVTDFYTPAPSTHKTTTNTTDPYNAKDYAHPDDFYYDYYDDFWDYEDAEEYWEEYGDW